MSSVTITTLCKESNTFKTYYANIIGQVSDVLEFIKQRDYVEVIAEESARGNVEEFETFEDYLNLVERADYDIFIEEHEEIQLFLLVDNMLFKAP